MTKFSKKRSQLKAVAGFSSRCSCPLLCADPVEGPWAAEDTTAWVMA